MLRAAWTVLGKDARLRLRDRSVWIFAFVVPIALTSVFSLIFPDENIELVAGVVDLDGGEVAAGFTQALLPALVDEGLLDATTFADEDAARAAVEDGTVDAAWIVPSGFSARVSQGQGGEIRVLVNPDRVLAGEVARGIADGFSAEIDRITLAVGTAAAAAQGQLTPEQFEAFAVEVAAATPAGVDELIAVERQLSPTSYLAAGMAIFFLFFTVTFGVTAYLEEEQQGTLPRLLAAPVPHGAVHLGKALGAFFLGIASMAVLAGASALLLDAPWAAGNIDGIIGAAVLIVAAVIASLGILALVGSFARTVDQATNLQSIVALVLGLIGGVFFPVGGDVLGRLAMISPHSWFLRGLGELAGEQVWTSVLPAAAALVTFGALTAIPGIVRTWRAMP